ncbi:unnamed protein product, partial [Haemonchus placei]|uniref:DUF148 domain-containing protein n=1 Tax=Haemonchus placei TaxID=6290 RepID=A0A0N4VUJ3_HAEPC
MQTLILVFLALITGARTALPWNGQSLPTSFTFETLSNTPSATQLKLHSYRSPPVASSYHQPYNFDFSHLFANPSSAATATASAYATNAAQFAQQFVATAPPVNAQVDQQNLVKYSQYLELLRNAYGIQLPGELGQQPSAQSQAEYQLSAYPSATATSYQTGAGQQAVQAQPTYQLSSYASAAAPTYQASAAQQSIPSQIEYQLTSYPLAGGQYQAGAGAYSSAVQPVDQTISHPTVTYATSAATPQPQYQVYQPQTSSFYGQ